MKDKKKLKLKKFYFHPITVFIFLTIMTILASAILSALQMQGTYSKVNTSNYELESVLVAVKNTQFFIICSIWNVDAYFNWTRCIIINWFS